MHLEGILVGKASWADADNRRWIFHWKRKLQETEPIHTNEQTDDKICQSVPGTDATDSTEQTSARASVRCGLF